MGNYAYVADRSSGLQIVNISNPTAPLLAGSYDTPGGARRFRPRQLRLRGGLGLRLADCRTFPIRPRRSLTGSYYTPDYARGVAVSATTPTWRIGSGLQVIDISNPAAPRWAGGYDTPGEPMAWPSRADYAYVAD